MADNRASESEGSDICDLDDFIINDFERDMLGEDVDPLIRAQAGADSGNEETHLRWVSNLLFGETDDSGEEFEGFHIEWMTDPWHFRPVNIPDFALNGGSTYQHPEETTAAYYFGLIWDDQVSNKMK